MNLYKKLKKGRMEQVLAIYEMMAESESPDENNEDSISYDYLFMKIDMYWKNIFPVHDIIDANKVCKRIMKRILVLDVDNVIDIVDLIYIYSNLFYLEIFIDKSIIQNSFINNSYSFIKDYLYRYESGSEYIRIKY